MSTEEKNTEAAPEFGKFSAETISALKAKNGKRLRYLKVTTEDGISEFILKKPSRATSSAVRDALEKKDETLASDIMLKNCVLAGDLEDIEEDAEVFTQVTQYIGTLVNKAEVAAKKL